jgi:hypothetical protein
MKIGFFLMTQKGFLVLENLLKCNYKNVISFVCVGVDKDVQSDFSKEIVSFCKLNSIVFFFRNELNQCRRMCIGT